MKKRRASLEAERGGRAVAAILAVSLCLGGCARDPVERARARLKRAGIAAEPASLVAAAEAGRTEALSWLLAAGIAPGAGAERGSTALVAAVRSNQLAAAAMLLDAGADINSRGGDGLSPLACALRGPVPETIRFLFERGASGEIDLRAGEPALVAAARAGDARLVYDLLAHGAQPNRAAADGWAALPFAVAKADEPTAIALLEKGADPNLPDPDRCPPLVRSVREGRSTWTALLLRHRADPNRPDASGETALAHAVRAGDNTAANILFAHGATARNAGALLAVALVQGNNPLADQLLDRGADPNAPGPDGRPPMRIALDRRDMRLVRTLLEAGASPHAALLEAVGRADADLADLLLRFKADPNGATPDGEPLLAAAMRLPQPRIVEALLRHGADPGRPGREGQAPLAVAVARSQPRLVRLLLEHKADPNRALADPLGKEFLALIENEKIRSCFAEDTRLTPLMLAAGLGDEEIVRDLLDHGAKKDVRTGRCKYYPLDIAAQGRHVAAMQRLLGKEPSSRWTGVYIEISLSQQTARLWENGKLKLTSPVSTGRSGYRTPKGEYVITNKYRHWTSTIYHVAMPYFMRLSCGSFGLHAGYLPGYPASHGCIRMPPGEARAFFAASEVGHRVTITD